MQSHPEPTSKMLRRIARELSHRDAAEGLAFVVLAAFAICAALVPGGM